MDIKLELYFCYLPDVISLKYKFLFVHIPKTGGNSLQKSLIRYSNDEIVKSHIHHDGMNMFSVENKQYKTKKHFTLNDYKRVLPNDIFIDLCKFSIIRNPWDRAISFYFSPHQGRKIWCRDDFIKIIDKLQPMTDYIGGVKSDSEIDLLLRFENLSDEYQTLCKKLRIPQTLLEHYNKSEHCHYSLYYDAELIELIGSKFKKDIQIGHYQFDKV